MVAELKKAFEPESPPKTFSTKTELELIDVPHPTLTEQETGRNRAHWMSRIFQHFLSRRVWARLWPQSSSNPKTDGLETRRCTRECTKKTTPISYHLRSPLAMASALCMAPDHCHTRGTATEVQFKAVCDALRQHAARFILQGDEIQLDRGRSNMVLLDRAGRRKWKMHEVDADLSSLRWEKTPNM